VKAGYTNEKLTISSQGRPTRSCFSDLLANVCHCIIFCFHWLQDFSGDINKPQKWKKSKHRST